MMRTMTTGGGAIVVQLAGGLGNQLFQYAFGRSLSLDTGRRLVLDRKSGFLLDWTYRRSFALDPLSIVGSAAGLGQSVGFYAAKAFRRPKALKTGLCVIDCPWGRHLVETRQAYYPQIPDLLTARTVWCEGYWQSPEYFSRHSKVLESELCPVEPLDQRIRELGHRAADEQSVAIGVRLFEECPIPQKGVVGASFFHWAIDLVKSRVRKPTFYLFSTDRFRAATLLPEGLQWVDATTSAGVDNAMDAYWLMSQCQHHVIAPSTLYWWAAWMSARRRESPSCTVVHDNYADPSCVPAGWIRHGPKSSCSANPPLRAC
jgi:hypothetical protein